MNKVLEMICLTVFAYFCIVTVSVVYTLIMEPEEELIERERAQVEQVKIIGTESSYLISLKKDGKIEQIEVPIKNTKMIFEKNEKTYINYERSYKNYFMKRLEAFRSLVVTAKEDVSVLYIDKKILVGDEKEKDFLD